MPAPPPPLPKLDISRAPSDQAYFGYSHEKLVARFVTKLVKMDLSKRGSIALTEFLAGVEKESSIRGFFMCTLPNTSAHPLVAILAATVKVLKGRDQGRKVKEIFKEGPRFMSAFLNLRS